MVIGSVIIVVLFILALFHPSAVAGGGISSTTKYLIWGNFTQVSTRSFGNETQIYYISWYGCPIGAADSWAFYIALKQLGNVSAYVTPHYSDPYDSAPNTPGLLFASTIQLPGVHFQSYYLYNEFLNVSSNGIVLNKANTVSVGLNELKLSLPANIYEMEYEAMQTIPTEGLSGAQPPVASAVTLNHVNTNVIVTGPFGAWILNGPLYSPAVLQGLNSTALLSSATHNTAILHASETVVSVLNSS